jgi:hypothetical protein
VITAETLGGAAPAQATQGQNVILGTDNTGATGRTGFFTTTGEEALLANPATGQGVVAQGTGIGAGVTGTGGPNGIGVVGNGGSTSGSGVVGVGTGGLAGVLGQAGGNSGSGSGDGVFGVGGGSGGNGVRGTATAAGGVGVLAENTNGGPAFQATGPALFSRSGTAVIPSGKTKGTVTPPGGLSSSALVLAIMQNVTGGVMVKAAVPSPGTGTFQIVLNKAPASPATAIVAWFVVN